MKTKERDSARSKRSKRNSRSSLRRNSKRKRNWTARRDGKESRRSTGTGRVPKRSNFINMSGQTPSSTIGSKMRTMEGRKSRKRNQSQESDTWRMLSTNMRIGGQIHRRCLGLGMMIHLHTSNSKCKTIGEAHRSVTRRNLAEGEGKGLTRVIGKNGHRNRRSHAGQSHGNWKSG